MCTALTYKTKDFYFGRTLDYEFSYGDEIVITPRSYPFRFRFFGEVKNHSALIGMAHREDNYPLYYEAVNEDGLCMAGLNFVGNAKYEKPTPDGEYVAVFEFIPWILTQCKTTDEAEEAIRKIRLADEPFSEKLPSAQLHWLIADKNRAITVEAVCGGIKIYENPLGVLTNNPPFDMQMLNVANYMGLSPKQPENNLGVPLQSYSRGMGAIGLPGDLSSQSRFVRVAFVRQNSISKDGEEASVGQFFHILGAAEQQRGCCEVEKGKYEITLYTSCCNADKGIYYYTTYENRRINAVDMHRENLDSESLICFAPETRESINYQNR